MRSFSLVILATAMGATEAFVSQASTSRCQHVALSAAAENTNEVRRTIKRITKDNMDESLSTIEPFLTEKAGMTFYTKSLNRLSYKLKEIGAEMPASLVKTAKCTEKRREKQNAFIQAKEEARLAAEAEAAAAAAEAAAAPVEEPEAVAA